MKSEKYWSLSSQKILMDQIVDIHRLAAIFMASHHTLKKNWQKLPHIFIGEGKNLKGARFIVSEVIEFKKKEARNVCLERSKKKCLDCQIQTQQKAVQKRGIQDKTESLGVGSSETTRNRKPIENGAGGDPYDLLSGVDSLS